MQNSIAPASLRAPQRVGAARTRRRLLIAASVVGLAAAIGGLAYRSSGPAPAAAPAAEPPVMTVSTVPVGMARISDVLLVNGSLSPWEDLSIGSEAAGLTIVQVLVEEGDWVKAGQVLARLDDALLQAQLRQTMAQIDRAKATLKTNDADVARARELLKTNAISVQAAEQRQSTADAARADLALAEAQRAAIQAQIDQTIIRAPTDGLISQRMARLGRVVSTSDVLFREVRDGILELDAEIPDRLLSRLAPGQSVRIRREDGVEVTGTVRLVAPLVDKASRNGIAHVRFARDTWLKAGMFVSGELILDSADQLAVPEASVLVKDGHKLVFTVGEGDKAELRAVQTGESTDGKIAIRGGLAAGDRVVTSGAGFLHDGDRVRVENAGTG